MYTYVHMLWHREAYSAVSVKSASPENQLEFRHICRLLGSYIKYVDYYLLFLFFLSLPLVFRSIFYTVRELLSDMGTGVSDFVIICT